LDAWNGQHTHTMSPADLVATDRSILEQLEGITVEGGWTIGKHIPKAEDQSGGFFSEGYECASRRGERAFFKAIDMFSALQQEDVITALNTLTDGVRCETELLQQCRRMDRVVSALEFGYIREHKGQRLVIPIPYIIFERADGSIRNLVRARVQPSAEWCLLTLHHIATGLMQLHRQRIAH
jgi:eukaryotic-like serine/threonine-protein kinase